MQSAWPDKVQTVSGSKVHGVSGSASRSPRSWVEFSDLAAEPG